MALADDDGKATAAPMAIARPDTLHLVGTRTKAVPEAVRAAFARKLEDWVEATCGGNQTHAGKLLGFSQGHISAVILGTRGPGLDILLALRHQTGKTADELLGFGATAEASPVASLLSKLQSDMADLRKEVLEQPNRRVGPHSKAGKRFAEVERVRQRAVGQQHLDAKARAASETATHRSRKDKAG